MTVLAMDLGGSHVEGGVVRDGRVLASFSLAVTAVSFAQLARSIEEQLWDCCSRAGVTPRECGGLGVGVPSLVDGRTHEILCAFNKFKDITGPALAQWADQAFGLPVRLENDASLALLGEHAAGNARGAQDAVLVTLGTGIGTGTMLNGRLLRSRTGYAGALGGHLVVRYGGRRCACGAVGCAEAEASTSVLPSLAKDWPGFSESVLARAAALDFKTVFEGKDQGDRVATALVEHCIAVWSALAVTLVHAYGPEVLLFGGGVMRRGEEVLGPIQSFVEHHVWKTSRGLPRVEAAALGQNAALVGAEALFVRTE